MTEKEQKEMLKDMVKKAFPHPAVAAAAIAGVHVFTYLATQFVRKVVEEML